MKCLLVKPPFAMWIVQGVKTVEYRKRKTQIRGRIGILECAPLKPIGIGTREIIGDVELWNCADYYKNGLVGWEFRNARRYKHPIAIPFPHGAQTWVNVDYEVPAEFYPELSTAERNKLEAEKLFTESEFLRKYLVHEEDDDAQYSIQEIEISNYMVWCKCRTEIGTNTCEFRRYFFNKKGEHVPAFPNGISKHICLRKQLDKDYGK